MDTVSDSGLAALRSRLTIPVLGPGLVQQHVAAMLGRRFSILTMWERWRPMYEKTMAEYGTRALLRLDPLDRHASRSGAAARRQARRSCSPRSSARGARRSSRTDADVILIGSTTMHQSVEHLRRTLGVPVINPGPLAIKLAELFVTLGLSHSKRGLHGPESSRTRSCTRWSPPRRPRPEPRGVSAPWLRRPVVAGLALSVLAMGTSTFTTLGLGALAPYLRSSFGLSTFEVGALPALVFLGAVSVSVAAGKLTDRVGAGRALAMSLVGVAVGIGFAAVAPNTIAFLIGVALGGVGYGAVNPATNVLSTSLVPRSSRAFFLSIKQAGVTLGGLLAGAILPSLADADGVARGADRADRVPARVRDRGAVGGAA